MSGKPYLPGAGGDPDRIEVYLIEEVLRRVMKVEECERKIEVVEARLREMVDATPPQSLPGLSKDDLYRRAYKADYDWNNLSGTLKWHMALCDMYSGAATAIATHRRLAHPRAGSMGWQKGLQFPTD